MYIWNNNKFNFFLLYNYFKFVYISIMVFKCVKGELIDIRGEI